METEIALDSYEHLMVDDRLLKRQGVVSVENTLGFPFIILMLSFLRKGFEVSKASLHQVWEQHFRAGR